MSAARSTRTSPRLHVLAVTAASVHSFVTDAETLLIVTVLLGSWSIEAAPATVKSMRDAEATGAASSSTAAERLVLSESSSGTQASLPSRSLRLTPLSPSTQSVELFSSTDHSADDT